MRQNDEKKDSRLSGAIRIFEALSSADEELLERSESAGKAVPFWRYAKVMAACLCVVVLGAAAFAGKNMFFVKDNASYDNMAASTAEQQLTGAASDTTGMSGAVGQAASVDKTEANAAAEAAEADSEEEQEKNLLTEELQSGAGKSETGRINDSQMAQEISESHASAEQLEKDVQDEELLWDMGDFYVQDSLEEADIRATEELGVYVPTGIPAGYVYESGYRTGEADAAESLSVLWRNGMDTIHVSISRYEESEEMQERLADISQPETFDVHRYEIPYCDSVPDEYYMTFQDPIFRESDFSPDIVKMRMKSVSDQGDTDTPRGRFAVLYDSGVLVEFNGDGDVQSIWKLFLSIAP